MAHVAVHLDKRRAGRRGRETGGQRVVEQRLAPPFHTPVRADGIERPALPAVTDRAAEAFRRVRREQVLPMGPPRLLGLLESSPADALVARNAPIGPLQALDPDLLRARWHGPRRVGAERALDGAAELPLVEPVVVLRVAHDDEDRRGRQRDAQHGQGDVVPAARQRRWWRWRLLRGGPAPGHLRTSPASRATSPMATTIPTTGRATGRRPSTR